MEAKEPWRCFRQKQLRGHGPAGERGGSRGPLGGLPGTRQGWVRLCLQLGARERGKGFLRVALRRC